MRACLQLSYLGQEYEFLYRKILFFSGTYFMISFTGHSYTNRIEEMIKMEFRPCIDIHNGKVKQIVGSSLNDGVAEAVENFVSDQDAAYFADFYKKDGVSGGHVIILNPEGSPYYQDTKEQALRALRTYKGGLQVGGGITPRNAEEFLEAGASHVIVTSYVFQNRELNYSNLERLKSTVGKKQIVLDLSCRRNGSDYFIVTNRWQKFTEERLSHELLDRLMEYADEFLIHAADVEGKVSGIETDLIRLLGLWGKIPVTYAGGIHNFRDLIQLRELGRHNLNATIGSALNLFGGTMKYNEVLEFFRKEQQHEIYENAWNRK